MFSLFYKRKAKTGAVEDRLPLSLTKRQALLLQDFRGSETHKALQQIIQELTEARAQALLKPMSLEEHNFERGVLFGYRQLHDVVDAFTTRCQEKQRYDDSRNERAGTAGATIGAWGNPFYARLP